MSQTPTRSRNDSCLDSLGLLLQLERIFPNYTVGEKLKKFQMSGDRNAGCWFAITFWYNARWGMSGNNLPVLHRWINNSSSRPAWTRSCAACCRWPCFGARVGLDDPQSSLPTPTILWFSDSVILSMCILLCPPGSQYITIQKKTQDWILPD